MPKWREGEHLMNDIQDMAHAPTLKALTDYRLLKLFKVPGMLRQVCLLWKLIKWLDPNNEQFFMQQEVMRME